MGEDFMAVFQLNPKRRVWQRFFNYAIDLNRPLFGHLSPATGNRVARTDGKTPKSLSYQGFRNPTFREEAANGSIFRAIPLLLRAE